MTRPGKRLFDLIVSAIGLGLCTPFLPLIALAVRLDSNGPVFFSQERIGTGFRPFRVLKLRTMTDRVSGVAITCGDDPRITRVGRVIRRFKLDEVPQLWNVFRGDMSMVGPRPEVREHVALYVEDYKLVLSVRPGITDPASIAYRSEAELLGMAKDPEAYYRRVVLPHKIRMSREYLIKANLRTDLAVLVRTLVACLAPQDLHYGDFPDGEANEGASSPHLRQ
jgi:lipopolysaccharide/colanic/teichoic acid biosynthesis glycosyltransferase